MKKEPTYDELDAMMERFASASFKCGNYWPTIDEIKEQLEPEIAKNMEFMIWISETASDPQTPEEEASRKYLRKLIYDNLKVKEGRPKKSKQ